MPIVELASIGAGGGSIAWLDSAGSLHVGPQSAGADPGPICYGKGGTQPTFTDAAFVSGLLDPDNFLGGEIRIDLEAARRGLRTTIADPLGLSVEEAASGVVTVAEAKMASTLEQITIGLGHDPREFCLIAYGGGGPLVGAALAQRLEIPTVIVPGSPAAFSAWGMLTLDLVHDFSKTDVSKLELVTGSDLRKAFRELAAQAEEALSRDDVPPGRRRLRYALDMRYEGQEHTLTVRLDPAEIEDVDIEQLRQRFDRDHETAYTYSLTDPVEVVGYRVRAIGVMAKPERPAAPNGASGSPAAIIARRRAFHHEFGGELMWDVYARADLRPGYTVAGPAIVQEPTATTIVPPSWTLEVDTIGNLVLHMGGLVMDGFVR
jgi:N-methylhydantoinase A